MSLGVSLNSFNVIACDRPLVNRLPIDIYVHPGIIKGGIQRKHISILWVGKEE